MKTKIDVTSLFAPMAICLALIVLPLVPIDVLVSSAGAIGTSSIQGTVTDASNPLGLLGVCVTVVDQGANTVGTATTASDGTYDVGVPAGIYFVEFDPTCSGTASSPDVPQWYSNSLTESGATQVPVSTGTTTSSIDALLQLSGSISGTVTDAFNPTGLNGVCVSAVSSDGGSGSGSAVTGANGTYTIAGLEPDSYTVSFDPTCSGTNSTLDIATSYGSAVSVGAGAVTQDISVVLATIPGASTNIAVTSSANPGTPGTPVTYSAMVTPTDNGGTVAFSDNGQLIAACVARSVAAAVASCTLTYPGTGLHEISAAYTGDENYAPSNSTDYAESIQANSPAPSPSSPVKTAIDLTSSADPATPGSVTYSAAVSPTDNNGKVSFFDALQPIAGCQDVVLGSGTAKCIVIDPSFGSHVISASFSGSSGYDPSTSSNLDVAVLYSTATTLASSYNPAGDQAGISFTATTSPSPTGGTVRFEISGTTITGCAHKTLANGASTCQVTDLRPGNHAITAVYSGDSEFLTSTSKTYSEKILQNSEVIVRSSNGVAKKGKLIHFQAKVDAKYGSGYLTFTDNGQAVKGCNKVELRSGVGVCSVRNLSVGHHIISVAFSGNARFGPSYGGLLEVVKP